MKIKIKYWPETTLKIKQIEKGNWIDLRAYSNIRMEAGEHMLIPLGIAMKLPDNYEAHLSPRSSTFKNYGILMANSVGVIDASYSGNNDQWMFSAYATRDTFISKGDRICQFRIMEIQPEIEFEEVDSLDEVDRGGFGSTGIY